jgi:hypothetical protein
MSDLIIGYSGFYPFKKWITSLVLIPFAIYYLANWGQYTLIDNANLIIHEAGHFFFSFFGSFIYAAGGTIMQILFPFFIALYFLRTGYRTGTQIFLFWLGQNLINISVYAADAEVRILPLLGNGQHDWYYMLRQLGILNQAELVGWFFIGMAVLVMVISLLFPLYTDE